MIIKVVSYATYIPSNNRKSQYIGRLHNGMHPLILNHDSNLLHLKNIIKNATNTRHFELAFAGQSLDNHPDKTPLSDIGITSESVIDITLSNANTVLLQIIMKSNREYIDCEINVEDSLYFFDEIYSCIIKSANSEQIGWKSNPQNYIYSITSLDYSGSKESAIKKIFELQYAIDRLTQHYDVLLGMKADPFVFRLPPNITTKLLYKDIMLGRMNRVRDISHERKSKNKELCWYDFAAVSNECILHDFGDFMYMNGESMERLFAFVKGDYNSVYNIHHPIHAVVLLPSGYSLVFANVPLKLQTSKKCIVC